MGDETNARWHIVSKFINGRWYRYRQKSWYENGRVRTRSIYLEPADGYVRRRKGKENSGLPLSAQAIEIGTIPQNAFSTNTSNGAFAEKVTSTKTK